MTGPPEREAEATARKLVVEGNLEEARSELERFKVPSKPDQMDAKLRHNLAVLNYLLSGKTTHSQLEAELAAIIAQSTNPREDAATERKEDAASVDPLNLILFHYNRAIVQYQQCEFGRCCESANSVYQICSKEDVVRRRPELAVLGCFLFIEVLLLLNRTEECKAVMEYLQSFPVQTLVTSPSDSAEYETRVEEEQQKHNFRLHQFSARISLAVRNYRQLKGDIRHAVSLSQDDAATLFLKSAHDYLRGNFTRAIKTLDECPKPEPEGGCQHLGVLYHNNLGVIHMRLDKVATAASHFIRALKLNTGYTAHSSGTTRQPGTTHLVYNRQDELLYNIALANLQMGEHVQAFDMFEKLAPTFGHMPQLWIRMAECSICQHMKQQLKAFEGPLYRVHGHGIHRKAVFFRAFSPPLEPAREGMKLTAALQHLEAAVDLAIFASEEKAPMTPATSPNTLATAPAPKELETMEVYARLLLSFVYLQLGLFMMAQEEATSVLESETLDPVLTFHATLYRGYALIKQGRPQQALAGLSPDALTKQPDKEESADVKGKATAGSAPKGKERKGSQGNANGKSTPPSPSVLFGNLLPEEAKAHVHLCRVAALLQTGSHKAAGRALTNAMKLLEATRQRQTEASSSVRLAAHLQHLAMLYAQGRFQELEALVLTALY